MTGRLPGPGAIAASSARQRSDGFARTDLVNLPGGEFRMGSDHHYPEEGPAHVARVRAFWIERFPVTNSQFAAFVDATAHVTVAERAPPAEDYPEVDPRSLVPGSLVFQPRQSSRGSPDWRQWWAFVAGASWRHPAGPDSDIQTLGDHPVVHVAYEDAQAYARWVGRELPSEAEWEFAARGGLVGAAYAWGNELEPQGKILANYWQGRFPDENLLLDGFAGTSPVDVFPANAYGLYDMIGNVWEWTADTYKARHAPPNRCCSGTRVKQESQTDSPHTDNTDPRQEMNVVKGGSHLCAHNYCQRYRPAARSPQALDTSSSHIGFRCVLRGAA